MEEVKQFPAVERRRNPAVPYEQREAGEVAVFQELGKALTSSLQLDQVLRTIMEKIDEFLRPDNWSLLLLDEAKQELYFELAVGKASQALKDVRIKIGQGIAGWVAQNGETVVVPDTSKDTRFFGKVDEKTKMETQSIVAVPVKFRDTCLGVIELINCVGPEGFDPRDLKLLEALSDFAAIALENARHVKRIHELTITDDCTTLYNARHMEFILDTEIYRSQRYNYEFSLVFIDLDHFKQVNDTHGHLIGSRLLAEIGKALKNTLPADRFCVSLRRRRICDFAAANFQGKRAQRGAPPAQTDSRNGLASRGKLNIHVTPSWAWLLIPWIRAPKKNCCTLPTKPCTW